MITHQEREKITLDFSTRRRKKDVEVKFGGDDIRFLEKLKQMRYSDHTVQVYPHLFQHSFATHLIEQGTDLKIVQELLEHNNIKTTELYVHIADTYKSKIKSPLDDILMEETL